MKKIAMVIMMFFCVVTNGFAEGFIESSVDGEFYAPNPFRFAFHNTLLNAIVMENKDLVFGVESDSNFLKNTVLVFPSIVQREYFDFYKENYYDVPFYTLEQLISLLVMRHENVRIFDKSHADIDLNNFDKTEDCFFVGAKNEEGGFLTLYFTFSKETDGVKVYKASYLNKYHKLKGPDPRASYRILEYLEKQEEMYMQYRTGRY